MQVRELHRTKTIKDNLNPRWDEASSCLELGSSYICTAEHPCAPAEICGQKFEFLDQPLLLAAHSDLPVAVPTAHASVTGHGRGHVGVGGVQWMWRNESLLDVDRIRVSFEQYMPRINMCKQHPHFRREAFECS